jgi:hypothetical protein
VNRLRLGTWQSVGVLASIVWIVCGGLWIHQRVVYRLSAPARYASSDCLDARAVQRDGTIPKDLNWDPCIKKFQSEFLSAVTNSGYYAAGFTLAPLPLFWLLLYGALQSARWIRSRMERRGSRPSE